MCSARGSRASKPYADRILNVDTSVADLWGRLQVPNPVHVVDGLLAGTALVYDLTLVTRNVGDVSRRAFAPSIHSRQPCPSDQG
jgi:predicted nucleic acid-binding protein